METEATPRELVEPSGDDTESVFFSAKGGVGKSTVAAASATKLAEAGYETLLVTTDPAAHLEDIFGEPVGHEPTSTAGAVPR